MAVFRLIDLITLPVGLPFGAGISNHVFVDRFLREGGGIDLIQPTRDTAILGGDSADYGLKSARGYE